MGGRSERAEKHIITNKTEPGRCLCEVCRRETDAPGSDAAVQQLHRDVGPYRQPGSFR